MYGARLSEIMTYDKKGWKCLIQLWHAGTNSYEIVVIPTLKPYHSGEGSVCSGLCYISEPISHDTFNEVNSVQK